MLATVTITETAAVGSHLSATDVDDLRHVRRLLLQAVFSVEGEEGETRSYDVPVVTLAALRGWLSMNGCADKRHARRLLLMALLELEDEDDGRRFVTPRLIMPRVLLK